MAEDESQVPGIGLDDAIEALRADLIAAMEKGAGKPVQFPVEKMTVELDVVATKSLDGKYYSCYFTLSGRVSLVP